MIDEQRISSMAVLNISAPFVYISPESSGTQATPFLFVVSGLDAGWLWSSVLGIAKREKQMEAWELLTKRCMGFLMWDK